MARPIRPRFETFVFKPKTSSDPARVPAGATIEFYKAGATVHLAPEEVFTIPPYTEDVPVPVYDVGRIGGGDQLRVDVSGPFLLCTGVSNAQELLITNNDGSAVHLYEGNRLVDLSDRPSAFLTPIEDNSAGIGTSITTDETGRATCYLSQDRVDYATEISGEATRLTIDAAPSYGRSDNTVINVRDYPNPQAAIDALSPDGGSIYFPAGTYSLTAGLTLDRPGVTLFGDGPATRIQPLIDATHNYVDQFHVVTVNAAYCKIRDLVLDGRATSAGSKSCLRMNGLGASGNLVLQCRLENLVVQGAPAHGLHLVDMITFTAENCQFVFNRTHGAVIEPAPTNPAGATSTTFISCAFSQNDGKGIVADQVFGLTFFTCTNEGNKSGWAADEGNAIHATNCLHIQVIGCGFEDAATADASHPTRRAEQMIYLGNCFSAIIDGCNFYGDPETSSPPHRKPNRAVRFAQSPWSRLTNCVAQGMQTEFAYFHNDSHECIEFGNRSLDSDFPMFTIETSARVMSLSRKALGLYTLADDTVRPSSDITRSGSLIWNNSPTDSPNKLQVWDGSSWKGISIPVVVNLVNTSNSMGAPATLATLPGFYVLYVYALCTHASGGSTPAPSLTVVAAWTDDGGSRGDTLINGLSLVATGGPETPTRVIQLASGSITYQAVISGTVGAAKYSLYLRLIPVG